MTFLHHAATAAAVVCLGCSTDSTRLSGSRDGSAQDAASADARNRDAPSSTCTPDLPDACPTPKPGYANEVVPILEAKCNGCHDGHDGGPWPLTNHDLVVHWTSAILATLEHCTMPPSTSPMPITEAERHTLIAWLVCGAPNN